jgi:hypothetical protein
MSPLQLLLEQPIVRWRTDPFPGNKDDAGWMHFTSKDMKMTNTRRTLNRFLFVAAAALPLGAISVPADAQVGVQIQFGVPGIVVDARDPYYYSPNYCAGCWYGEWGGRTGYHRGGGRPWERRHVESDHHGHDHGHDVWHEGHR